MAGTSQSLRVSYGTFSCTVEGFDDNLGVMKDVALFFRDLVAGEPGFATHTAVDPAAFAERAGARLPVGGRAVLSDGGFLFSAQDGEADGAELDGPGAIDAAIARLAAEEARIGEDGEADERADASPEESGAELSADAEPEADADEVRDADASPEADDGMAEEVAARAHGAGSEGDEAWDVSAESVAEDAPALTGAAVQEASNADEAAAEPAGEHVEAEHHAAEGDAEGTQEAADSDMTVAEEPLAARAETDTGPADEDVEAAAGDEAASEQGEAAVSEHDTTGSEHAEAEHVTTGSEHAEGEHVEADEPPVADVEEDAGKDQVLSEPAVAGADAPSPEADDGEPAGEGPSDVLALTDPDPDPDGRSEAMAEDGGEVTGRVGDSPEEASDAEDRHEPFGMADEPEDGTTVQGMAGDEGLAEAELIGTEELDHAVATADEAPRDEALPEPHGYEDALWAEVDRDDEDAPAGEEVAAAKDPFAGMDDSDFAEDVPFAETRTAAGRQDRARTMLEEMFGEEAEEPATWGTGADEADEDAPEAPFAAGAEGTPRDDEPEAGDARDDGFGAELARLLDDADVAHGPRPHDDDAHPAVTGIYGAAQASRRRRLLSEDTVPEEAVERLMHDADDRIEAAESEGSFNAIQRLRHAVMAAGGGQPDAGTSEDETEADDATGQKPPLEIETTRDRSALRDEDDVPAEDRQGEGEDEDEDEDDGDAETSSARNVAPMVLVSSQRVDASSAPEDEDEGDEEDFSGPGGTAAALAATWKRRALVAPDDRMMAAAALIAQASPDSVFTRSEVMELFAEASRGPALPPEERMRAFGLLVRHGRIRRADRGRYALAREEAIPAE